MKTFRDKSVIQTQISNADREKLSRVIKILSPFVKPDSIGEIGKYSTLSVDELWVMLVIQFCVIGSAVRIERIESDPDNYQKFKEAVSFSVVSNQDNPVLYLTETLYKATRFYRKRAKDLTIVLKSPTVFKDNTVVLFKGLSHKDDVFQTRDELIKRCPGFNLKSASDFMISVGLSHDIIALDIRIINFLRKHFDYNLKAGHIQANREYYFSLEAALREFCQEAGISLALLDRLIFTFSTLSILDFVIGTPRFSQEFG